MRGGEVRPDVVAGFTFAPCAVCTAPKPLSLSAAKGGSLRLTEVFPKALFKKIESMTGLMLL